MNAHGGSPLKRLVTLSAILIFAAGYIGLTATPAHAKCTDVKFSKSNYHVNEVDGEVAITIKRDISLLGCPGTLTYSTQDDSATAPYDYTQTSDEYIFTEPTQSTHTFTIPIVNDVLLEGPERFKVTFEAFNDATTERGTATVTIADNRFATPPPPPPPSTTTSSSGSSSSVVSSNKPARSGSTPAAAPSPPIQQEPVEAEPAIETPPEAPALGGAVIAQAKNRTVDGKKLLALLMVALLAASGVILAVWRLRRSPREHFSTL